MSEIPGLLSQCEYQVQPLATWQVCFVLLTKYGYKQATIGSHGFIAHI